MSEEEPTSSEKDMQEADDEKETLEESDDNTSDPPEKALADSDKDDANEEEDTDSVAHFTDNCQLKRRNGNDVGIVLSVKTRDGGVVLECDDGLHTAQARVRNGNVEIKTSTLRPFSGNEEDILYIKRSQ